jgi:regulator of sigma D
MSEIFERLLYQPVRTARVGGVPSIDFAANKEAIRSQSATADAMSRIASFAFESAKRSQQISGAERGVADAQGTLESLSGRDRTSFSFEEQAAFEAASKTLSVELGIKAKRAMGEVILKATNENYNPEELATSLDAVVEGFAQSVDLLDPISGQEFRLGLEDSRNAQYLNYSEKYLTNERQETRARTILNADTLLRDIEMMAEQGTVNWDEKMDQAITQYMDYLSTGLLSPSEVAIKGVQARKLAHVARINGEFGRLKTISEKREYLDSLQNDIITVDGKKDSEKVSEKGIARGLYNSEAKTVLTSLAQEFNFQLTGLTDKAKSVATDMKSNVTSIVNSGGVVSQDKLTDIETKIQELEEQGAPLEVINELKVNLQSSKEDLDYVKSLKKLNISELKKEIDQLDQEWQRDANPVIAFKLKRTRAEFEIKRQELLAQQAEIKPELDRLEEMLAATEELADAGEPIHYWIYEDIDSVIRRIEDKEGYIAGTLDSVKEQYAELKSFSNFVMDIKDDSASELEDKLIAVQSSLEEANQDPQVSPFNVWKANFILKRQTALNARLNAVKSGVKKDPMLWANDSGLVNLETNLVERIFQPLKSPEDRNALKAAIDKRIEQANRVRDHHEIPTAQIFTEVEAASIADMLNSPDIPIETKGAMLNALGTSFGKHTRNVIRQVASKETATQYMHIAGILANGADPLVVQQALIGEIKYKAGEMPTSDAQLFIDKANRTFGSLGIQPGTVNTMVNIKNVANYIYLGSGNTEYNDEAYEEALQKAAGRIGVGDNATGGIVEYNGKPVIIPNNISHENGLENIFDNLESIDDLIKYAVKIDRDGQISKNYDAPQGIVDGEPLTLKQVKDAQLITVGDGLYRLMDSEGRTFFGDDLLPYVIDLKTLGPGAKVPDDLQT